jgi:hypothetical protein
MANEIRSGDDRPRLAPRFARVRSVSGRPVTASADLPPLRRRTRARRRRPHGVPAARRLVLVREAGEQHGCVRMRQPGTRDCERGGDGIPLLWHRRGASRRRLGDLAHLCLREQHDVETDLRGRARRAVECRAELRDSLAVRVPGEHGLYELELRWRRAERPRVRRLRRRVPAAPPSCAASAVSDTAEPARLEHRDEPAAAPSAREGRRHCLLEEGAPPSASSGVRARERAHRRRRAGRAR